MSCNYKASGKKFVFRFTKAVVWVLVLVAACTLFFQRAYANINAIDFSQVHYPSQFQADVDFLKANEQVYNHWSPNWDASIAKVDVIAKLKALYDD